MLLIKCKCGCLFTTKDDVVPISSYLTCQGCSKAVQYLPGHDDFLRFKSYFSDAGMTVQKIPDDADITVTFKA